MVLPVLTGEGELRLVVTGEMVDQEGFDALLHVLVPEPIRLLGVAGVALAGQFADQFAMEAAVGVERDVEPIRDPLGSDFDNAVHDDDGAACQRAVCTQRHHVGHD
ncbi:hypothetical protein AB0K12_46850 [Nonomuraea sp. NPDC049419]|uniref:hypothetical protein n=1 Tax=Nonomuraea sp. NPDC049419 TaxID=3155772 RepID=UPI00342894B0